jgi:DNA-binding PadR family transcriptional regulator
MADDIDQETGGYAQRMRTEVRRGGLAMAVLAALHREHYGYSLRKRLEEAGIDIDEGTLYPLIRRLESYGLLESEWRDSEGRRRRYYRVSEEGLSTFRQMYRDSEQMLKSSHDLLEGAA